MRSASLEEAESSCLDSSNVRDMVCLSSPRNHQTPPPPNVHFIDVSSGQATWLLRRGRRRGWQKSSGLFCCCAVTTSHFLQHSRSEAQEGHSSRKQVLCSRNQVAGRRTGRLWVSLLFQNADLILMFCSLYFLACVNTALHKQARSCVPMPAANAR